MLVDHERAWHLLKERLRGKQGIGVGSLYSLMGELEVECTTEEGLTEKAMRLYGREMLAAVARSEHPGSGDLARSGWFAGFADGEGCFSIEHNRSRGTYGVRFVLGLRADDQDIIGGLVAAFGGRTCVTQPSRAGQHPRAQWTVEAKADLLRLVRYFDDFPPRAKKARDYEVWRRAVLDYVEHGSHGPELPRLFEEIRAIRKYETSGIQPAPVPSQASARDGERAALPRVDDGSKEEQDGGRNAAAAGVV